jgi:hypothetical protein
MRMGSTTRFPRRYRPSGPRTSATVRPAAGTGNGQGWLDNGGDGPGERDRRHGGRRLYRGRVRKGIRGQSWGPTEIDKKWTARADDLVLEVRFLWLRIEGVHFEENPMKMAVLFLFGAAITVEPIVALRLPGKIRCCALNTPQLSRGAKNLAEK